MFYDFLFYTLLVSVYFIFFHSGYDVVVYSITQL